MAGTFISFEGPDGAGKTSVLRAIVERLKPILGDDLVLTREPGGFDNKISEQIRDVILDPANTEMDPRTEVLLFAASRRQHVEQTIKPALAAGKVVITDRYVDSSIAYQGGGRELGEETVANVNAYAIDGLYPDKTVYLDVAPEVGLTRIHTMRTDEVNRLDKDELSFHQRVSGAYHKLAAADADRFIMIDAEQDLDQVIADTWAALQPVLGITEK